MLRFKPPQKRGKLTSLVIALFLFTLSFGYTNITLTPVALADICDPNMDPNCPESGECEVDVTGACVPLPEEGCENPAGCLPEEMPTVNVCDIENGMFNILEGLSQQEADDHLQNQDPDGDDFIIDDNDANPDNDTEDCRPEDQPGEECPFGCPPQAPATVCDVNGVNFQLVQYPNMQQALDHLNADGPNFDDFLVNDNDADPNNDTNDCQGKKNGGGGGGNPCPFGCPGDNPGDDPDPNCDVNDPNCNLGGDPNCPMGCPGDNPGDGGNGGGDPDGGDEPGDGGDGDGGDSIDLSSNSTCPQNGFKDYGYSSDDEYNRAVSTWLRCEGIAHGNADNNIYFSPEETIIYSHFLKMVQRAAEVGDENSVAQKAHVLGSDVAQYFDLALSEGLVQESDRQYMNSSITLTQAEAITSTILGYTMSFAESRTDGLLGRQTAAQDLFELFAK